MITGARRIKDLIRNRAESDSAKSQMLLRHYAMECLLERLSVSDYSDDFIIKGGMLVSSLIGVDERTTRDIDATTRGHDMSLDNVSRILAEVASIDIGDGFAFELGEPREIMEGHWSRYQAANSFAESVSWQDALASLRAMASAVKDAKTAD